MYTNIVHENLVIRKRFGEWNLYVISIFVFHCSIGLNWVAKAGMIVTKYPWPILTSYYHKAWQYYQGQCRAQLEPVLIKLILRRVNFFLFSTPPLQTHIMFHFTQRHVSSAADNSLLNYQLINTHICFGVHHTGVKIRERLCYRNVAFR